MGWANKYIIPWELSPFHVIQVEVQDFRLTEANLEPGCPSSIVLSRVKRKGSFRYTFLTPGSLFNIDYLLKAFVINFLLSPSGSIRNTNNFFDNVHTPRLTCFLTLNVYSFVYFLYYFIEISQTLHTENSPPLPTFSKIPDLFNQV